jgi:hypothetical protein
MPGAHLNHSLRFIVAGLLAGAAVAALVLAAARGEDGAPDAPPPQLADLGAPDQLCIFWSTGVGGQAEPCG